MPKSPSAARASSGMGARLGTTTFGGLGIHVSLLWVLITFLLVSVIVIGYAGQQEHLAKRELPDTDVNGELTVKGKQLSVSEAGASSGMDSGLTITKRVVGHHIITTILVDLVAGSYKSGGSADDILGADGAASQLADLSKTDVFGKNPQVHMRCTEVPTGGDPDINLVAGTTAGESEDAAVTGASVLSNNGDFTAVGQTAATNPSTTNPAATPHLYLTTGAATDAAYTAGKFEITIVGLRF